MTTQQPKYAGIPDTSRILGLGRSKIYELIASGDLTAYKIGRRTLVDLDAAVTWIERQPRAQVVS
jgi:excisionase family DNA binding protein